MSVFFHRHNVKSPNLSNDYFKTQFMLDNYYTKCQLGSTDFLAICVKFSKSIQLFADFTIGNETGHLLICVVLYGKFIDISET